MRNRTPFLFTGKGRLFLCVIVATAMLGMLPGNAGRRAYAHETPDMTRKGSVNITMQLDEKPVSGGTLTLYQAGVVDEDDGNYSFVPEERFRNWGDSFWDREFFEKEDTARMAKSLEEYVRERGITGTVREIGADGTVSFTNLELGLYLLVQDVAAEGCIKMEPFLVSVPMEENGGYIYDVDASPKVELAKLPVEPSKPEQPEMPGGSKLPQTGQLNWPIPLLVVSGLCLLSAGWLLLFGKRKSDRREADLEK